MGQLLSGGPYTDIDAGYAFTCALDPDGVLACVGKDGPVTSTVPTGRYAAIAAGVSHHACVLEVDGAALCWGGNGEGQATPPV